MRFMKISVSASLLWLMSLPMLAEDNTVTWLSNYTEAIEEAKRTQKPIFLEYRCEP
jgi:hypothetical protein